jgi:hypothetical protein
MRWSLVVMVAFAVGVSGCTKVDAPHEPDERACTAHFVYGLSVIVKDKVSGERLCDAEVVALAGSYRETLQVFGPSETCTYTGAGERPDVYELRASRPGFQLATVSAVRVAADECHVIPAEVTMNLER